MSDLPTSQDHSSATKKDIVVIMNETQQMISNLQASNQIQLPPNYSPGNALKALQLKIQDDDKLVSCSKASIAKTALKMIILGLNPLKEQCYAIPYGNECKLFVSHFGDIAICKNIDPNIKDIIAKAVRKSEKFNFKAELDGSYTVFEHEQTMESLSSKEFIGGYATIIYNDGSRKSHVMTIDKIKSSWKKSILKPITENGEIRKGTTHDEYTEDMIMKTLIHRVCKFIKNTSDDANLFRQTLDELEVEELESEEIAANEIANSHIGQGEYITIQMGGEE